MKLVKACSLMFPIGLVVLAFYLEYPRPEWSVALAWVAGMLFMRVLWADQIAIAIKSQREEKP